jgi:hypothetical protein
MCEALRVSCGCHRELHFLWDRSALWVAFSWLQVKRKQRINSFLRWGERDGKRGPGMGLVRRF